MPQVNLNLLDLNLLKVFKVLLEERSTVKAAERLHMAQPSVSRSLKRLREQFDDQLFVPSSQGLLLTARCEILSRSIPSLLNDLSQAIESSYEFNPAEKIDKLVLAVNPLLGQSLPAEIFLMLQQKAPNIEFSTEIWNNQTLDKLSTGQILIGINYSPLQTKKEIISTLLAVDNFKACISQSHPLTRLVNPTLKDIARYPIATAIAPDWNQHKTLIEEVFEQFGLSLIQGFRSEIIANIAQVTALSEQIFPTSELYDSRDLALVDFRLHEFDKTFAKAIHLYGHYRHRHDPYYQWLNNEIQQIVNNIMKRTAAYS
ncbi:LysR family transcriptional regulator [Psychromonas aquimarina]|uniref:LysR family transcriptional regulator n=1 Tax=Psychromonas aquimarina TaxID=444919 RepID=UPI00041D29A1|nr:LysR family transcriptional regulator [Psychromonas aquimarina]